MMTLNSRFADRAEAGRKLAARLLPMNLERPIVYALPRGGVPVAFEIARALRAPLDLVLVRKIGVPGHPEFGLGAVVDGVPQHVVAQLEVPLDYIEAETQRQLQAIERYRARYLGGRQLIDVEGRTVIVV